MEPEGAGKDAQAGRSDSGGDGWFKSDHWLQGFHPSRRWRMADLPPNADGRGGPATARRVLVVDGNRDAADSTAMLLWMYGYV